MSYKIIFILLIIFAFINNSFAQSVKKIQIVNSNSIDYDEKNLGKDIKRLKGNVEFKHDNALMLCDSAYFNTKINTVKAFSKIHFNQGDSINLYGDLFFYDGNTKIAKVRKNVRLENNSAVLLTDSLNFDRNTNIGYYFNNGVIKDSNNVLTSNSGYYYSDTKDFFAIDSVKLVNKRYTMDSDTLKYNTESKISTFHGPTTIVSDTNLIYCENGWYNTVTNISQYNKNSYLKSKNTKLSGDSLYYDRNLGIGKAFNNVELIDTSEKIMLTGNYGKYREHPESSFITDSATFIQFNTSDSLYLHGDTLKYILVTNKIKLDSIINDTINKTKDTIFYTKIDSFKLLRAYNKVKLFKSDLQAKCDSLVYSFKDSSIELYTNPIIWSDKNQLTADFIKLYTVKNKPYKINLENNAFIISNEDTIRYNQIKGRNMIGYFKNDSLYKVDVVGNGESIYFPKDDSDTSNVELIGVNKVESSNMIIFLANNRPNKIIFKTMPKGVLNPINYLKADQLILKNFIWLDNIRPKQISDIFIWDNVVKNNTTIIKN